MDQETGLCAVVDVSDLMLVVQTLGEPAAAPDFDGLVDVSDLLTVITNLGAPARSNRRPDDAAAFAYAAATPGSAPAP